MSGGALTAGIAGPIGLDFTSLLFTFAISAVTTMVFGLAPARQASRVDPQVALRDARAGRAQPAIAGITACAARSSSSKSRSRWCC